MHQTDTIDEIITPRTNVHTFLLCCGVAGSLLFTFIYFAYGAIAPDYNMLRQPVGDLELLGDGWIQIVNYIVFGLFNLAFAEGLRREMINGFGTTLIPLSLASASVGLILLGLLIHNPAHTLAGCIAYLSLMSSFLLLALRFAGDYRWKGWSTYNIVTAILMTIFLTMFGYAESIGAGYAGAFERLAIIVRLVWSFVLTFRLLDGRSMMQ
jgi:hypothetical protein